MNLSKKYNYNINDMEIVKTLPTNLTKYIYIVREDERIILMIYYIKTILEIQ